MTASRRVLVTGAAGFVGRALLAACAAAGEDATAIVRRPTAMAGAARAHAQDLAAELALPDVLLQGVDTLYHLAALAHGKGDARQLRRTNVELPLALARQAAAAGLRRFVFLSSVGAQAQSAATPLTEGLPPRPASAYGRSKREAELELQAVAAETGLELVILRPPLVVGRGAPGNLARLAAWAAAGRPLPHATLRNRRSLVSLPELVSALRLAAECPLAAGEIFLVANPEPLSTGDLFRLLAAAAGRSARFVPLPRLAVEPLLRASGRSAMADGLFGDLLIDPSRIRDRLGWRPAGRIEQAVATALDPGTDRQP